MASEYMLTSMGNNELYYYGCNKVIISIRVVQF